MNCRVEEFDVISLVFNVFLYLLGCSMGLDILCSRGVEHGS